MAERRTIVDFALDVLVPAGLLRGPTTWGAWLVFLRVLFALPLDADALALYRRCTGRKLPPTEPAREAWLVVGRRGGKSFAAAVVAVFLAAFRTWHLSPGERGVVMVIAPDRKQARVIFRYVGALLDGVSMLSNLVERRTAEVVDLSNGISIEVHTCSYRTTRGYTVVAALLDEVAFWRSDDSANPDREIVAALRPAMATVPDALLLGLSSPHAQRGVLHDAYRAHYGNDTDALVWQADTRTMNPTVPQRVIDDAYERDPASAAAEYGAEFRRDLESFVSRETADACTVQGRHELPPVSDLHYEGFCDPSGGSNDSMTLAVAHREDDTVVVDCVRERRPPFSPDDVCREFADVLKGYGLRSVTGDRYGGEWPRERFRAHAIEYSLARKTKNDLYLDLLPDLNAHRVELLDHGKLAAQLCSLERRARSGGKDTVDHPPRGHDDIINAVGGVVDLCRAGRLETWKPEDVFLVPLASQSDPMNPRDRPTNYAEQRLYEMGAWSSAPWDD